MQWISDKEILIVGLGLMGGSYAKALTRLGFRVCAIDRDEKAIDFAVLHGYIASGSTEPDPELIGQADAVIFALYPAAFVDWIESYQHLLKPGAYVTDVTGVKAPVVDRIQTMLRKDVEFIAAHPMAGREVSGVQNADERIFLGANYIVVPTARNTPEAIAWCQSLGRLLGFGKISLLSPKQHDEMIGFVSQLTHCIAIALMTCNDNRHLADYTGDSFRDLTRISRINETMWSELFLQNRDELVRQIDRFTKELTAIRDLIAKQDREGLMDKMRLSTERRAYFDR